jgi:lipopolysaccharide/colanic/teichoic acid biosynthesis glycosyltransferase
MDLHYIANAGVSEDIRILLATLKRIIAKEPELNWEDEDVDA